MRSLKSRLKSLEKISFGKQKWVTIGVGCWRGDDGFEQAKKEVEEKYFEENPQDRGRVNIVILQGSYTVHE